MNVPDPTNNIGDKKPRRKGSGMEEHRIQIHFADLGERAACIALAHETGVTPSRIFTALWKMARPQLEKEMREKRVVYVAGEVVI